MKSKKNFLTLKEVASLLQLSYSNVYAMVRSHALPALQIGRVWRVPEDELHMWLSAQLQEVD